MIALALLLAGSLPAGLTNRIAPALVGKDLFGHAVRNRDLEGRATVLFVFCSCPECRRVAERWSQVQRTWKKPVSQTLVSYSGPPKEAKAFATAIGFDRQSTRVIADDAMKNAKAYQAMPCPSVYVIDSARVVRYASKEVAGELEVDPRILIGQTLEALKAPSPRFVLPPTASTTLLLRAVGDPSCSMPEADAYQWGTNDLASSGPVEVLRSFEFVNPWKKAVSLTRVMASCGCTEAVMVYGGSVVKSLRLPPGNKVTLRVKVNLPDVLSSKTVTAWIYTAAPNPVAWAQLDVQRKRN